MNLLQKNIDDNVNMLIINDIDVDEYKTLEDLKLIIRYLTNGDKFYFKFNREDNDFLTDDEIVKYRNDIPKYFIENGDYKVKEKIDNERFESIGYLKVKEDTYDEIGVLWKYFYAMMFFNPNTLLTWEKYNNIYNKIEPKKYGIGIIKNKYAKSIFIKGHDGDNLIFVYDNSIKQPVINEVITMIKNL
ncbi:hypothetical protein [Clostridium manihotivorum]|uniref:Uncharacterized protein n=1 Tax=Clostridium manihotivorum TaxID=2320868 RepID=A0A3R5UHE2_9CLOT|nr:hypothetical protein [Clostridium manihotivorum]QAA33762.1 hypothetical protein C1I91_20200 [Clostridium manihotivorum]